MKHGRRRTEIRPDRLQSVDRGVARVELRARGDDRVPAQSERQVRHDAKGVIDVEPVEHLLDRAACPQLPGRPAVQRRAVPQTRDLDGVQVRPGATFKDSRAGTQRSNH